MCIFFLKVSEENYKYIAHKWVLRYVPFFRLDVEVEIKLYLMGINVNMGIITK